MGTDMSVLDTLWDKAKKLNPLRHAFWIAGDLHYWFQPVDIPGESFPSWLRLAATTRRVRQANMKVWCSEGDLKMLPDGEMTWESAVPNVVARLDRVDIWPWIGRAISLYCVEINITVSVNGEELTFSRRLAYRQYVDALSDFNAHAKPQLRWTLRSPSMTPPAQRPEAQVPSDQLGGGSKC